MAAKPPQVHTPHTHMCLASVRSALCLVEVLEHSAPDRMHYTQLKRSHFLNRVLQESSGSFSWSGFDMEVLHTTSNYMCMSVSGCVCVLVCMCVC